MINEYKKLTSPVFILCSLLFIRKKIDKKKIFFDKNLFDRKINCNFTAKKLLNLNHKIFYTMKKTLLFAAALATFVSANALTYNVTVPTGTNECYVVGEMNSWSFEDKMTKVDDTHFTISLDDAKESHGYKYCSGPDWAYEELSSDGKGIDNRSYSANDVVAKWKAVFTVDPTAEVVYFIKHPWKDGANESWSYKELTDNGDGTYSIRDIYGGNGCNWKSNKSGEKWIENPTLVGNPAVGDSAIFTLTSTEGDGAITITKIETASSGDTGGETGGETGGDTSGDVTNDITIRVQIPEGLSSWEYTVTPNLYYWTTETDGKFEEMTLVDGWYSYTVNAATVNFIVVNGSSWAALNEDSRRQTVDVKGVTASGCYILGNGTEIEGDGETWKKTVTATDCNGSTALDNPEIANIYATNGRIENIGTARIYTVTGLDVTSQNGSLHGVYIVKTANTVQKVVVK